MYAKVPVWLNVCERLWPAGKMPVSKLPSDAVAECEVGPSLFQVTVSPTLTVIVPGLNEKSTMVTDPSAAATALGAGFFSLRSSARNRGSGGAGSGAGSNGTGSGSAGAGSPGAGPAGGGA